MAEAVKKHLGIDFMAIEGDAEAVAAAKAAGVDMDGVEPTWGHALYECYDQKVEELMIQPTFITMHPVDVSPLAKRSPKDPRLTERFELFICRSEMGNAFSELNDPIDQKQRFEKQVELRAKGDDEAGMMDTDFINALEYGMPPTGGLGIGIDRCAMLLTGCDSIRDVILFPTMKPDVYKRQDIAGSAGSEVLAADSGTIAVATYSSSYGNYVTIYHSNGDYTLYAHMSSLAVTAGQNVTQGDVIAVSYTHLAEGFCPVCERDGYRRH